MYGGIKPPAIPVRNNENNWLYINKILPLVVLGILKYVNPINAPLKRNWETKVSRCITMRRIYFLRI